MERSVIYEIDRKNTANFSLRLQDNEVPLHTMSFAPIPRLINFQSSSLISMLSSLGRMKSF